MTDGEGLGLDEAADAAGTKTPGLVPAAAKYGQELSRSLSFRENVLITLSSVTPASSVFIIVPAIISAIGGASFLAMGIAGLISITVAMCYAELSSAFPVTGGEYAFVARTLGRPYGFALFVVTIVGGVLVLGVIASGAGEYLAVLTPALNGPWVGVVVVLATATLACFRIKANAWVTGLFLALEMGALVVLSVLGFVHVSRPVTELLHVGTAEGNPVLGVAVGLVVANAASALLAYSGYGASVYFAEETKQPRSTVGRAILWSLAITVAAEMIPLAAVILGAPSMRGLIAAPNPVSYFLLSRGGPVLNTIVSIGIAIAIINAVLAIVLQVGRLIYSSARDRSWPEWMNRPLGRIHPRLKTPVIGTAVVGVAGALLLVLVPFDALLLITGANVLVTLLLVGLAALVGRINGTTREAGYRMPLWPFVPVVMVLATAYITYQTVVSSFASVLITVALFVVGIVYFVLYLRPRGDRWTLPDPADEEIP